MKRIPMTVQMVLVLFLVLVIPCVALTLYSTSLITRSSEEEIAGAAMHNIETSHQLTEMMTSTVSSSAHQMAAYTDFSGLNNLSRFSSIQGNVENGVKVQRIQQELAKLIRTDPTVISAFFLLDGADYVISSDRGLVTLENYPSMNWLRTVSEERRGIGGVWVPRTMKRASDNELQRGIGDDRDVNVLSYVYSLSRLTTSTGGTLVVNLAEREVCDSLNPGGTEDALYGTMLLQANGRVMSHPDQSNFLIQSRNLPNIATVLDSPQAEGYAFHDLNGSSCLYTWLRSDYPGWVYVSIQPLTGLRQQSQAVLRNVVAFTIVVVLASTVLAVTVTTLLLRPMRELARSLRAAGAGQAEGATRNELAFITSAFQGIQRQEAELSGLLEKHEKAALNLALYNTLTSEHVPDGELALVRQALPHPFYMVAMLAIDDYNTYRRATGSELRNYHLLLIAAQSEELLGDTCRVRGIKYAGDRLAVVMNFEAAPRPGEPTGKLAAGGLEQLRLAAGDILGHTVTIGLSPVAGPDGIWQAAAQANEAVLRRLKTGGDCILPWQQDTIARRYHYPHDSAVRILNYLDIGDMGQISRELETLARDLRENDGISHENIRYIYIQLVGDAIRHLAENNENTTFLFSAHGNVYGAIASCDTLDEVGAFMNAFYRDIIDEVGRDAPREKQVLDSVLQTLRARYREDIDFDALARDNGISYSYMRKVVRQATGKSLTDHLNQLRVEQAKQLLAGTDDGIAVVAQAAGYHNVQSLNRFFRKMEGLTPGEYRAQHRQNH